MEQDSPSISKLMGQGGRSRECRNSEPSGWTPLHIAVAVGSTEMVGLLLDRGADIEAGTFASCNTPLHVAIMAVDSGESIEVANLLLDRGADIQALGNLGNFAVLVKRVIGGVTVTQERAANANQVTPLHMAVLQNHPESTTLLLDRGADAKDQHSRWGTPCLMARELDRFTLTPLLGRLCRP